MVFCCSERGSHLVIAHDSYEDRLFFGCFAERGAWSRAIYDYRSGEAGGEECVHSDHGERPARAGEGLPGGG